MANFRFATAAARIGSENASRSAAVRAKAFVTGLGAVAFVCATPCPAASNNVRISGLTDLTFGTIANLGTDAVLSENVCAYSNSSTSGYRITASGSGTGSAFSLSSGTNQLAYEVQWSASPGQSSGSQLTSSVPLTGQISSATQQVCNAGPASSATLIVVLRSSALSNATAGSYSGTLTLVIGPE